MKLPTFWQLNLIPWYALAVYWLIGSLHMKRVKAAEKSADRITTILFMVVAFLLLFSDFFRIGPLRLRFVSAMAWISWLGLCLTCLGVAIAVWARHCLGAQWSARVTLKVDHQLIRSGPYAYVRHPIYSGMLLGVMGTALLVGEWRGVLAIALVVIAHSRKARREESMLATEFGSTYAQYRQHTGFLFPRISRDLPA